MTDVNRLPFLGGLRYRLASLVLMMIVALALTACHGGLPRPQDDLHRLLETYRGGRLSDFADLEIVQDSGYNDWIGVRPGTSLRVGRAQLEDVRYSFMEGRLKAIEVRFDSTDAYFLLMNELNDRCGDPYIAHDSQMIRLWQCGPTHVSLRYYRLSNKGVLRVSYEAT